MDDAAIHRVLIDACGVVCCLLAHSGSPRAFCPRDDKGGGGLLFVIARRTTGRRGNPSCLGRRGKETMLDSLLTVDQQKLR